MIHPPKHAIHPRFNPGIFFLVKSVSKGGAKNLLTPTSFNSGITQNKKEGKIMFPKKPVSKYSTFQNIWFMIKLACTSQEKKVLVISFFITLLTIIQNLLNLYVSPVILSAIENHVSIQELLFTIVIFVLMMMLVSAALAYANQNVIYGRISVRCEIVNLLNKKASTTSYPNIDDMKFKKLLTKSDEYTDNNDQATEAIWNTLTVLLINIVCFFIYAGLLTQIHPILILVILSTAGISYFISQRLDEYKYQHREEEAEYIHQMAYLLNRAADFGAAKDIRIFGLRSWLEELYSKADREFTAFHRKAESVCIWAGIADLTFTFLRNGAVYAYLIYLVLYRSLDVPAFLLYFTQRTIFQAGLQEFWKDLAHCTDNLLIFPRSGNVWIIRNYSVSKMDLP